MHSYLGHLVAVTWSCFICYKKEHKDLKEEKSLFETIFRKFNFVRGLDKIKDYFRESSHYLDCMIFSPVSSTC